MRPCGRGGCLVGRELVGQSQNLNGREGMTGERQTVQCNVIGAVIGQRVIFFNDGKGGIKVARIARPKQNDAPTKAARAKDREDIPVLSHLLLRGRISVYFTPKFHLVLGPLDSPSCTSG